MSSADFFTLEAPQFSESVRSALKAMFDIGFERRVGIDIVDELISRVSTPEQLASIMGTDQMIAFVPETDALIVYRSE
jgi:hypothetical protein